jgi:hypothetical protein
MILNEAGDILTQTPARRKQLLEKAAEFLVVQLVDLLCGIRLFVIR